MAKVIPPKIKLVKSSWNEPNGERFNPWSHQLVIVIEMLGNKNTKAEHTIQAIIVVKAKALASIILSSLMLSPPFKKNNNYLFEKVIVLAPTKNSYIGPQTRPQERPQSISVQGICLKIITPSEVDESFHIFNIHA